MVTMQVATISREPGERFEIEFRVVGPGGSVRWLIARGSVEDDGLRIAGSFQDITKQKLVEEKLTELNDMKTEFVGVVAHDLKMPLTVASGYALFLLDHWDAVDDAERRTFVERMQRSLDRLGVLVEGVSEVTRLESGASALVIRPFDLEELVRSTAEDIASVEPDRPCHLSIDGPLPRALGDRESVWRVLTNLLSNAVKYSPASEPIAIAVGRRDDFIEVSITDRGPGIARSEQPKLFRKFSRLHSIGDVPRPSGTGLGLFICKSLVEAMGGSIWLESAPGEGATFSFTLPVADAARQAS